LGRSGTTQHKSGPRAWPVGAGYGNVDGLVLTPGRRDGCAPRQPSDFLQRSGFPRLFFYSRLRATVFHPERCSAPERFAGISGTSRASRRRTKV